MELNRMRNVIMEKIEPMAKAYVTAKRYYEDTRKKLDEFRATGDLNLLPTQFRFSVSDSLFTKKNKTQCAVLLHEMRVSLFNMMLDQRKDDMDEIVAPLKSGKMISDMATLLMNPDFGNAISPPATFFEPEPSAVEEEKDEQGGNQISPEEQSKKLKDIKQALQQIITHEWPQLCTANQIAVVAHAEKKDKIKEGKKIAEKDRAANQAPESLKPNHDAQSQASSSAKTGPNPHCFNPKQGIGKPPKGPRNPSERKRTRPASPYRGRRGSGRMPLSYGRFGGGKRGRGGRGTTFRSGNNNLSWRSTHA